MQARINLITLGTRNLEQATQFYQQGLNLPRVEFEGDIVFFELNGSWLALYPWDKLAEDATVAAAGEGFRGISLAQNVSSEAAVKEVLREVEAAGAKIIKPPQKADWGGFSGYFADLDDHLWEIVYSPFIWPGPQES